MNEVKLENGLSKKPTLEATRAGLLRLAKGDGFVVFAMAWSEKRECNVIRASWGEMPVDARRAVFTEMDKFWDDLWDEAEGAGVAHAPAEVEW